MKGLLIAVCLGVTVFFAACQPSLASSPAKKSLATETSAKATISSPVNMPISTATFWITPKVTATPIAATLHTDDELETLIERIYPFCIGSNEAKSSEAWAPSHLEFIEVDIQPDSQKYWISEIADNTDKSLQAFVACKPELCQDKIYVKDNKTGKVFEVDWEHRMPWRPIQWITWINNDVLAFLQSANPSHGTIKAISFSQKEYLFSALVFPDDYCSTSTPIP